MDIGITVDTREIEVALRKAPREFTRAIRNALNDTARDVQRAEQASLGRSFDLRRQKFNEQRIKVAPEDKATHTRLESAVRVDPLGGSLLGKYEEGDDREPRDSKTMPVPLPRIVDKGGHVKKGFTFASFAPFEEQGPASKLKRVKGKLVSAKLVTRGGQKVGRRGTFITRSTKGFAIVVQRVSRGTDKGLRVLFTFLERVDLKPQLGFVKRAKAVAPGAWQRRATEAIHHALRRAGLT